MATKKKSKKMTKKPAKKMATKKMTVKSKGAAKKMIAAAPKKMGPLPPKTPVVVTPKNKNTKQFTQGEFFDSLRGSCGFGSRKEAKEFYGDFATMIQSALKSGYKVVLPGLGKIQVRRTKARMGRNPMTQEQIMIPARKKVAFTANKALKEAVL